ncbi:MAG: hypothetical protein IJO94_00955 [Firmicutes bacterium]|nr:hypothetical protein [Bacillota bacterium]MBQ4092100.1 hypothetical protein [Bacillota bacterium]MBQ6809953.1 hypothetical protein [Bacillota bacterium]
MKKFTALVLVVLMCFAFCACGAEEEQTQTTEEMNVSYISDTEAKIYFYEITANNRCELMQMSEEEIKAGVDPHYWNGLAEEVAELSFDEITDAYATEEERTQLSQAYGVTVANLNFGVYAIADLQAGMDDLFGPGRVDVTTWSNGNLDIVSTNTFATSAGYFLYAKDSEQRFDTQIYNIISVTGGDGTATVKAQAVSVDNITDNAVYDLATIVENTDEAGNVTQSYKLLEGAYIENFDYGADFAANMSNMAVNTDYLGVMEFVFGINGISIYLDHINMP